MRNPFHWEGTGPVKALSMFFWKSLSKTHSTSHGCCTTHIPQQKESRNTAERFTVQANQAFTRDLQCELPLTHLQLSPEAQWGAQAHQRFQTLPKPALNWWHSSSCIRSRCTVPEAGSIPISLDHLHIAGERMSQDFAVSTAWFAGTEQALFSYARTPQPHGFRVTLF